MEATEIVRNEEQLNLYPDHGAESERAPGNERLRKIVLDLAGKWVDKGKKPDLIFFFSARDRYSPILADLPMPMMAKNEIPILKEIAGILDEAGIEFTRAQVNNRIKKLSEVAPKETADGWEERKDLL